MCQRSQQVGKSMTTVQQWSFRQHQWGCYLVALLTGCLHVISSQLRPGHRAMQTAVLLRPCSGLTLIRVKSNWLRATPHSCEVGGMNLTPPWWQPQPASHYPVRTGTHDTAQRSGDQNCNWILIICMDIFKNKIFHFKLVYKCKYLVIWLTNQCMCIINISFLYLFL